MTKVKDYPLAYACYNKDAEIRSESTSGGIFTLIASYVIQELDGVVFGASFDTEYCVRHVCIQDIEGLHMLRGSKYSQSIIGETYKQAREYLNAHRTVLFTGTPCQIAGLKAFLNKDYDELICMDFICHGVASPRVWDDYVKELKCKGEIKKIIFKSKVHGWKHWYFRVEYADHVYQMRGAMNKFMKSYLEYCNIRPSCFDCKFKGIKRDVEFTISDCWGVAESNKEINDDRGLSAVLIQNEKADRIFSKIEEKIKKIEYPAAKLMEGNWTAVRSVSPHKDRVSFFKLVEEQGGNEALDKYFKPSLRMWMGYYKKRLLGKEK